MKNKFMSFFSISLVTSFLLTSCFSSNENHNDNEDENKNFAINVEDLTNGYVIPSVASAKIGESISFKIVPNDGYYLTSFSLDSNITTISYEDKNLVFDNLSKTYTYNTIMEKEINVFASFDNKESGNTFYDKDNDVLYTTIKVDPYGNEIEKIPEINANDYLKEALNDGELGYIILKGQEEHYDANLRTKGAIDAINEIAKEGNFKSNLLEIGLCVDDNGMPWSDKIATEIIHNAVIKYENKLDLIIANNDSLAIAASKADNLNPSIPILGFDGIAFNEMLSGDFDGTMAFPFEDQALLTAALVGNLITNKKPVIDVFYGGKVPLDFTYLDKHLILTDYATVLRKDIEDYDIGAKRKVEKNNEVKGMKILLTSYSSFDSFAQRLFKSLLYYLEKIGYTVDTIVGDGNNDQAFMNSIKEKYNENNYDAIILNPIYLDSLKDYLAIFNETIPIVVYNRVNNNEFVTLNKENVYAVNITLDISKNAGNIVKKWYNHSIGLD